MPKYIARDGHKKLGGKLYAPGDAIECTEEVAAQLRLEPAGEKKQEAGNKKQESGSKKQEAGK